MKQRYPRLDFWQRLARAKIPCSVCGELIKGSRLNNHRKSAHEFRYDLDKHELTKLIKAYEISLPKTPQQVRFEKRREEKWIAAIEKSPDIRCQLCGDLVKVPLYRLHRVVKHGASPLILEKIDTKGTLPILKGSNISRPWQGGGPGLGKRR